MEDLSDFKFEVTWPMIPTPLTFEEEVDEDGMRRYTKSLMRYEGLRIWVSVLRVDTLVSVGLGPGLAKPRTCHYPNVREVPRVVPIN